MHLDLLDTVLVTRNHAAASRGPEPPAPRSMASRDADKCPVDHGAREAWLKQARAAHTGAATSPHDAAAAGKVTAPETSSGWSLAGWRIPFVSRIDAARSSAPAASSAASHQAGPGSAQAHDERQPNPHNLGTSRVVSSIPRTANIPPSSSSAAPANSETDTGSDPSTGHWVYPSEAQFFAALQRKGTTSTPAGSLPADMQTVVPIHNAVNERAWAEILGWEAPFCASQKCAGPRLHSFAGDSSRMTPRARMNTLLGYAAPFDRHDWVVDRCGQRVEYVIDFYAGRPGAAREEGKVSFYLDVRPKLNSWEGAKMRAMRVLGVV